MKYGIIPDDLITDYQGNKVCVLSQSVDEEGSL